MSIEAFLVIPVGGTNPPISSEPVTDTYFATTFSKAAVISVTSFTLGMENVASLGSASSGAGTGKASFSEVMIRKIVDNSSPSLLSVSASGRHFGAVQLYVRGAGAASGKPYLAYEFQTVFISKIEWGGSDGDEAPYEVLTLAYGALAVGYRENVNGNLAAPTKGGWSVISNTSAVTDTLVFN